MKHGRSIIVLIALAVVGCGQPQRRLKVTYDSDPPGGTLYRQDGELWGPCPKVLYYDLDEGSLATGQLEAKGLIVRWPSGPAKRSDDLIVFPLDGTEHKFTFVQAGQAPTDQSKQAKHEPDPGLREEPDAMTPAPQERAKPVESVNDSKQKQVETVQSEHEKDPGLREEPDTKPETPAETAEPARSVDEPARQQVEVTTTDDAPGANEPIAVPSAKVGAIAKAPVQPSEESVKVKIETRTVDFGNGVMMDFALIPAGEFTIEAHAGSLGSDPNQNRTQKVRITKPFCMGVYEVTQEQFEKVMQRNPSSYRGPKRPVERVSWHGAQRFCEELSRVGKGLCRLPTEAEWEHACRAGTITAYYWGDDFDSRYAWTLADRASGTHNVGTRLPNAWGLYDMSGNVWEWCSDWYNERDLSLAELIDPNGPSSGNFRVLRGGSWGHSQQSCQSAYRNWHTPNHRYDDCGFRVVLELDQLSEPTRQ